MRIPNFLNNCKRRIAGIVAYFNDYLLVYCTVVTVGLVMLLVQHNQQYYILRNASLLYVPASHTPPQTLKPSNNLDEVVSKTHIVASRKGKRYYYVWCVASNIKEENKVYFSSELDAENQGLTLSTRC